MSDDKDREDAPTPKPKPDPTFREQADEDPRGEDEVARELGPGDGDDPPPVTGDEPSPR